MSIFRRRRKRLRFRDLPPEWQDHIHRQEQWIRLYERQLTELRSQERIAKRGPVKERP